MLKSLLYFFSVYPFFLFPWVFNLFIKSIAVCDGVANTRPSICQLSFNFADGGFYLSNNFYDQVVKFVYLLLWLLNYKVILCCKVL